jgi:serine/threonine protein kinase
MVDIAFDDLDIQDEIGKGSWAVVRQGYIRSVGLVVAVKLEETSDEESLLLREAKILKHLQGIDGVPSLYKVGSNGTTNYIAMQRLHCTLDQLRRKGYLQDVQVLERALQLLSTIEQIHKRCIIHQDLKPKNLMTTKNNKATYLIDFGLSSSIATRGLRGPKDVGLIGTPSFSSLSTLLGIEQDRKDDLESLGYNLVWLLVGRLPWESYASHGSLSNLKTAKFHTPVSLVCQDCPDELAHYFNYIKGLQFNDVPDYQFLRSLIECALNRINASQTPSLLNPERSSRNMSLDLTNTRRSSSHVAYKEYSRDSSATTVLKSSAEHSKAKPPVLLNGSTGQETNLLSPIANRSDWFLELSESSCSESINEILESHQNFNLSIETSIKPVKSGLSSHLKHPMSPYLSPHVSSRQTPLRPVLPGKRSPDKGISFSEELPKSSKPEVVNTPIKFIDRMSTVVGRAPSLTPAAKARLSALKAKLKKELSS